MPTPELSKIKLNGVEYNIKDAEAREGLPLPENDEDVEDMLDNFELDYTSNSISVNQWQGGNY